MLPVRSAAGAWLLEYSRRPAVTNPSKSRMDHVCHRQRRGGQRQLGTLELHRHDAQRGVRPSGAATDAYGQTSRTSISVTVERT